MVSKTRPIVALLVLALLVPLVAVSAVSAQDGGEQPMVDRLYGGDFGGGSNPQVNFNPYVPATRLAPFGYIYEPLVVINDYDCSQVAWLASGWEWSDPQTLNFTVREGVTWSDGTPFTADDVAFTFNMIQQHQPLDEFGVWRFLSGVTASHPTVTFTFIEPGASLFTTLVGIHIVPKHLWESVADPMTYTNEEPVGTGPYLFQSFNGQEVVIERNPDYWQADKVRVQELVFSKAAEGQINQLKLVNGEYDWNAMFVPDIENTYVAEDPEHNKYWFPQGGLISLYLNLTIAPFDDPEFRRGLAHALDRQEIADKAQFGYVDIASQTGLNLPGMEQFLDPTIENQGFIPYDATMADQIWSDAGYTRDGDGRLLGKDGEPIQFTFKVQSGWNDWVQASQIIQEDLAAVGITMDVQTITPDIVLEDRKTGNFEALFGVFGGTCNMYRNFYDPFSTDRTKPIGEATVEGGNAVRWQDPETDELLAQLNVAATPEEQTPPLHGLQQIMVTEFPAIPLWYGAVWFQYRTENAEGWPSAENPYAHPLDNLLIFTTLVPAEG